MSMTATPTIRPSPWLSVWLSPRDTIQRIVALNPGHHVLLLASVGMTSGLVMLLTNAGLVSLLLDWRVFALTVIAGAFVGILDLYIFGFFLALIGRMLGGRAPPAHVRAAIAWGAAPSTVIVPIFALVRHAIIAPQSGRLELAYVVAASAIVLWSAIATMLMLGRVQGFGFWRTVVNFAVGGTSAIVFASLVLALSIRTFLFQPFSIPSTSMMPTLLEGDYIFVSKWSYGYSHYSFPFSPPLFSGRILGSEPQRGDVAVFRSPKDTSVDYIKRVVGLPNDRIQMINGVLHINGTPVVREQMADFVWTDDRGQTIAKRWRETLPNGVSYTTLDLQDHGFLDDTPIFTVPPGHYFVIGDNLDNSTDSRLADRFGFVPFENLIGRVAVIYFSQEPGGSAKQSTIRFDRIGMTVR